MKIEEVTAQDPSIENIQGKLKDLNTLIHPYQLAYVDPVNDCVLLEKNAHYMEKGMFEKLTYNIAEDGFLSQLPFAVLQENNKYLIISGNHRVKASMKAKLPYILILFIQDADKDKQIAYQLSHNALVGKDDQNMLKEIFQEIKNLENKEFSGLNDNSFIDESKIKFSTINDADIELVEMKFLFTKARSKEVAKILDRIEKLPESELTRLINIDFEDYIRVMTEIKKKSGIKSNTVAFNFMVELCERYLIDENISSQIDEI